MGLRLIPRNEPTDGIVSRLLNVANRGTISGTEVTPYFESCRWFIERIGAIVILTRDVGAVLAEKNAEIRRLNRALFIAHAIKAKFKWYWMSECKHNESCKLFPDQRKIKKFTNSAWVCSKSQDKCRAKAEEYK